jgi:hypothetical protein
MQGINLRLALARQSALSLLELRQALQARDAVPSRATVIAVAIVISAPDARLRSVSAAS